MRRIAATLAVVALLFSAGATLADDTSEANELFVEAVKLVKSVKNVEGLEEKAVVLEEALSKLDDIVEDYPSTDLAVKLISGQRIGAISLDRIGEAINKLREKAERERKRAEREAEDARKLEKILKAAEQGDVEAQLKLVWMYFNGSGVPNPYDKAPNNAEALKWLRKAAEQGHLKTQFQLGEMYDEGDWRKGVSENDAEAVKWYRKAAEQGYGLAQILLDSRS